MPKADMPFAPENKLQPFEPHQYAPWRAGLLDCVVRTCADARGIAMSRQAELLKLAKLCHLQANQTRSRATKQRLHKIGDYYQNEAERVSEDVQAANLPWFLRSHRPNEIDT